MSLLDSLKDIVKHTNGLGFIEMVKVIGSVNDAKIEAIDAEKTVVVFGTMYQPITGLESTIGLSRMSILKGNLDFPPFSSDKATIKLVTEVRNNVSVPTEVEFNSGEGHVSNYRFMGESMINEQIKVPAFKGATWNITIKPEKKRIADLAYFQGFLGGFEKRFTVNVDKNGTMNFGVGTGPTDRVNVPFATNVTGSMKNSWTWPLSQVLSILKLGDTADVSMDFSDMGALRIEIDSGIGKYQYILPAGKS